MSQGNKQTKAVGRCALLILKGRCLESIKLLMGHTLLNLTPSTQLKSQTQWQQNSKVVPMLSDTIPFPTSNKALSCHLKKVILLPFKIHF